MSRSLGKKLLRELWHIRLQVSSIAVVVGIGVAVLFGFSSTHESLLVSQARFYQDSNFSDLFIRVKKSPHYLSEQLSAIPGVLEVETRLEYDALVSVTGMKEPAVGHFISIPDGEQPEQNRLNLIQGRLPRHLALDEVVVTEGFFGAHQFELGDSVDATLNGRKKNLTIVGVGVSPEHIIAVQAGTPFPDDRHFSVLWINHSVLAASFDMRSSFNSAVLKTSSQNQAEALKDQVDHLTERYGGPGAMDRDHQLSHVYLREELKQLRVQALTIPVIFFLVAAFILNVVISRIIRSQRGEIATLKAIGYTDSEISKIYFGVALIIVGVGVVMGLVMGYGIGNSMIELYGTYYHLPALSYSFSYFHFLIASLVSLATAALGVLSSLRGVFQLSPAEAMRPPAPPNFHKNWLERQDWFRLMGTRPKMALRGIFHSPLRSCLTGLGLAFCIVILVSGLFWQDTMDRLMLIQYGFTQKESGTIALTHEVSASAVGEVARLPGVIQAEGYRQAAVKVRFQNREESTVVQAMPRGAQLAGLVNQDLEDIPIPNSGFALSEILAHQLDAQVGDSIEIEFLDGKKPIIRASVQGVVGSLMSNQIFTTRKTLAHALKTDDRVNEIRFRSFSDPNVLYTRLKEMPNVLSVTYRDSVLQFFDQNSKKFILVFALILSVFAGAIGFGVAFNSMRVAYSERDWELSTLQILGFSFPEVFRILANEVFFLLIVFIPIGWILGYANADWLIQKMSMDNFKIPFVIGPSTYFWATMTLLISTGLSGWLIYRLIRRSDIVATLKSRG